ncbi:MAG: HlyD family efflux transporter periplasmic adaptor subunit, partial [Oscillospiraceae bacterium]|nr:HlyD family efflux transporter periplasmic adaptor subunit [Oscillospiraceae bacterium]
QTISSLQSSIDDKQKAYDELVEEYEEFCESVETGGIVYAPVSGAVSQVNVSEGDKVQADSYLVTLMDKRYIYLTAAVSEEDITSLYVGQECSVSLTAYEGKSFAAHIDTISTEPARSSGSVSYTVTVKLDDESGLNVLEGMSGEIDFIEKQADNVLTVNVNAITFRDGVSYVKVYDETGNVTEKPVVTGFTDGRNVEIVSGAEEGDKVLVKIELSSSEKKK